MKYTVNTAKYSRIACLWNKTNIYTHKHQTLSTLTHEEEISDVPTDVLYEDVCLYVSYRHVCEEKLTHARKHFFIKTSNNVM